MFKPQKLTKISQNSQFSSASGFGFTTNRRVLIALVLYHTLPLLIPHPVNNMREKERGNIPSVSKILFPPCVEELISIKLVHSAK